MLTLVFRVEVVTALAKSMSLIFKTDFNFILFLFFRFALQEEKIMLANILRYFQLESIKNRTEIEMNPELVLRPKEPINIKFTLRN